MSIYSSAADLYNRIVDLIKVNGIPVKNRGVYFRDAYKDVIDTLFDIKNSKVDKVTGKGLSTEDYTSLEKTKLAGIATGATANDTDANLKNRAYHTGAQSSSTISDFTEAVQDAVAALLGAGSNVTLTYNDGANTLTVSAAGSGGLDAEAVRDAIGIALVGIGNISVVVNDALDTITISTTATVNDTDANLKDRANHTGNMPAANVTEDTTHRFATDSEKTAWNAKEDSSNKATDFSTVNHTKFPTVQAAATYIAAQIAALVASSPATLDTLNELAAALGNDPNFATSITALIGAKVGKTADKAAASDINAGTSDKFIEAGNLLASKVLFQDLAKIFPTITGAANTYVAAFTPAVTARPKIIIFKANATNTGASTVNPDTLGAIPLKKNGSTALASGDIVSGRIYILSDDGTNYQVISGLESGASGTAGGDFRGTFPNPIVDTISGDNSNKSYPYEIRSAIDSIFIQDQEDFTCDGVTHTFTLKNNIYKRSVNVFFANAAGTVWKRLVPYTDYIYNGNVVTLLNGESSGDKIGIQYSYLKPYANFAYNKGMRGNGTALNYISIPTLLNYARAPEWTLIIPIKPDASIAQYDGIWSNKYTASTLSGVTYTNGLIYLGYNLDGSTLYIRGVGYTAAGSAAMTVSSQNRFLTSGSDAQNLQLALRYRRVSASSWELALFENGVKTSTATASADLPTTWPSGFNFGTDGGQPAANDFWRPRFYERSLSDDELFLEHKNGNGIAPQERALFDVDLGSYFSSGGANYAYDQSGNLNNAKFEGINPVTNERTFALPSTTSLIIFDGNSIMLNNSPHVEFFRAKNSPLIATVNKAYAGAKTPDLTNRYEAIIKKLEDTSRLKNVYIFFEIGNDVQNNGANAATAYANAKAHYQKVRALNPNVLIVACGSLKRREAYSGNGVPVGFNTTINTVNNSFLADFTVATADAYTWKPGVGTTYADLYVNMQDSPGNNDPTDTASFLSADGVHRTLAGTVSFATQLVASHNQL